MTATLPLNLEIDGIMHVQHWRSQDRAVYQNYTDAVTPSDSPHPARRVPQLAGANEFHLYCVIQHEPGESLGAKLGTFSSLDAAITQAAQLA